MELCRALRDRWHPFGVGVFMGSTQMRKIGSCFVFLIDVKTWKILAFEKYQNLSAKCNARVFLWRGCALSAFSHNWHERFGETALNTGQFPCRGCLQVFSCLVSQLKGCQMWQKGLPNWAQWSLPRTMHLQIEDFYLWRYQHLEIPPKHVTYV